MLQHIVGRNLEKNVWYKEDRKSDVPLVAYEVEVFRKAKRESVGDVDTDLALACPH